MQTVLIVEDEPDLRFLARTVLRTAGYEVQEAEDGETALDMISGGKVRPDLVLLDIRMPGIDGWAVLARLHRDPAMLAEVPVIVFTAHFDSEDEVPIEFQKHEYFLSKPFDPDVLVQKVKKALEDRRAPGD